MHFHFHDLEMKAHVYLEFLSHQVVIKNCELSLFLKDDNFMSI